MSIAGDRDVGRINSTAWIRELAATSTNRPVDWLGFEPHKRHKLLELQALLQVRLRDAFETDDDSGVASARQTSRGGDSLKTGERA